MSDKKDVWNSLIMITQFGINMIVPIFIGFFFGWWLDNLLHTSFLIIVFFFIGAIAGGRNVYILAKKTFQRKDEEGKHDKKDTHN